jgi:hypothetical protein
MNTEPFDEQLRQRFDEQEVPFNPRLWQRMSHHLDAAGKGVVPQRRSWYVPLRLAAAALLALGVSAGLYQILRPAGPEAALVVAAGTQHEPQQVAPQVADDQAHEPVPVTDLIQDETAAPVQVVSITQPPAKIPIEPADFAAAEPGAAPQAAEAAQVPASNVATPMRPDLKLALQEGSYPTKKTSEPYKPEDDHKLSVSVAGGLNYGSLEGGYALGFNARHDLGGRFYIESDVAFVNNNRPQDAYTPLMNGFEPLGMPGEEAVATELPARPTQLYYLQLSPAIGYHLSEKLSLSMGADMQRLIHDDANSREVITADGIQIIPSLDLGVTGKTEVHITPRIRAGLLYREGLNRLLRQNQAMMDRRYVQVQLKFAIVR